MRPTAALAAVRAALALAALGLASPYPSAADSSPRFPDVLVVTIDTLRADRLSSSGYARPTSPHLDALLEEGFRFTNALTVEPLTNPAVASLLTSLPPHEHGATRNGLPARGGLVSLPALLAKRGYRTAAFVGNWTLKPRLSGLDEHWQDYDVVVSRKRWLGLFKDEATARDVTGAAVAWLDRLRRREPARPYLLWVHYVEPHAPYRLHDRHAKRLGFDPAQPSISDRYDSEIAEVDAEVGRLLAELDARATERDRLTVFTSDHGEALGEDGEIGHGRRLHAPTLIIPLAFVAPGRVPRGSSARPVSTLDVAPTVLALLGLPSHPYFRGRDVSPAMRGEPLAAASLCLQAHRGAVQSMQRSQRARRAGLLEVGRLDGSGWLEVVRPASGEHRWDRLATSPPAAAAPADSRGPSAALTRCLDAIREGLEQNDRYLPPELDEEELEQLRALGYLE